MIDLRDWELPMFSETFATVGNPASPIFSVPEVRRWNDKIAGGNACLFITPEYNHSVPAASGGLPLVAPSLLASDMSTALLREIFTAAGGTHDDFSAYDKAMAAERRTAVLVTPHMSTATRDGRPPARPATAGAVRLQGANNV